MKIWDKVYRRNKDIVSREMDNEMILMPIYRRSKAVSEMYTLNKTAMLIWSLVDGKRRLKEITDILCKKHKASRGRIEGDIEEFIKDLKQIKAIE